MFLLKQVKKKKQQNWIKHLNKSVYNNTLKCMSVQGKKFKLNWKKFSIKG